MKEEIEYMKKMKVWKKIPEKKEPKYFSEYIPTKWVLVNKGTDEAPEVRARLVACEVKTGAPKEEEYYSPTPPIEALRMLVSIAASDPTFVIDCNDVRKAHLNGDSVRQVIVKLPPEAGGGFGLLQRTLYGTRDAATQWEKKVTETFKECGLSQGVASSCLWFCPKSMLRVFIHGDDLVSLGPIEVVLRFRRKIQAVWDIKARGMMAGTQQSKDNNVVASLQILGRSLTRDESGYTWEADPRQISLLLKGCDSPVAAPGQKPGSDAAVDHPKLVDEEVRRFRSALMRAAYIAQDRPDIAYSVKEIAKAMMTPTTEDMEKLRRVIRYMKGRPTIKLRYGWQALPTKIVVKSDSDHAGCPKSRKSTTGIAVFFGQHLLFTSAKAQSLIALSSGEAELYAIISATSTGLGTKSLMRDLGIETEVQVCSDAEAGLAMAQKKGLLRTKHLHTAWLWVQKASETGEVTFVKIPTETNESDLLTKYLARPRIDKLMSTMGFITYGLTAGC